ncbi:Helix-loop-helix DNA-binding domain protein [Ancylostoma ceylanicum]|uniref:Helix-loop-helix DNA-binding domain protein n=1 Tax=Ancylostoma ceylanicum TaxID=53326 RepID=A0A0D6M920_9BILA|nr:Helix-loop-helix DNA-binding domain protein [Ancylostoma ceylanicum]
MVKHNIILASTAKDADDAEPLDLTMPKSSRTPDDSSEELMCAPTQQELGGQLLIKLLQQQILLTMLPKPDTVVERRHTYHRPRARKTSECSEKKEAMVVNIRRSEANARERNRVQHLADMFDRLRAVLPIEYDVKISKLATLKIASAYIRYLGCVLDADDVCRIVESEQILMLSICEAKIFPKKILAA